MERQIFDFFSDCLVSNRKFTPYSCIFKGILCVTGIKFQCIQHAALYRRAWVALLLALVVVENQNGDSFIYSLCLFLFLIISDRILRRQMFYLLIDFLHSYIVGTISLKSDYLSICLEID
jgi:hypothetical protein